MIYIVYVPKSAPGRSPMGVNSFIVSAVDEASALNAAKAAGDALRIPAGAIIDPAAGWIAVPVAPGDLAVAGVAFEGDPIGATAWNVQRGA